MIPGGTARCTLPPPREPTKTEIFYQTSNQAYSGHWHDGAPGHKLGDVPTISEVLDAKPTVRRPVRPLITTAQTLIHDQMNKTREARYTDKVLSADVRPKKYPVEAQAFCYPASGRKGADNPIFATSSQAYGREPPMEHQVPDRYFPSTSVFTNGFNDPKARFTGLNTAWSPSRIHTSMDEYL